MDEDIVHMNMICLKFQHSLQRVSKSLDLEFELINSYEEKSVSTEDLRKRRAREGPSLSHIYTYASPDGVNLLLQMLHLREIKDN